LIGDHEVATSSSVRAQLWCDGSSAERSAVTDLPGMTYVSVDELVHQSGSRQGTVQMVLLEIELTGKRERGVGGKVRFAA